MSKDIVTGIEDRSTLQEASFGRKTQEKVTTAPTEVGRTEVSQPIVGKVAVESVRPKLMLIEGGLNKEGLACPTGFSYAALTQGDIDKGISTSGRIPVSEGARIIKGNPIAYFLHHANRVDYYAAKGDNTVTERMVLQTQLAMSRISTLSALVSDTNTYEDQLNDIALKTAQHLDEWLPLDTHTIALARAGQQE